MGGWGPIAAIGSMNWGFFVGTCVLLWLGLYPQTGFRAFVHWHSTLVPGTAATAAATLSVARHTEFKPHPSINTASMRSASRTLCMASCNYGYQRVAWALTMCGFVWGRPYGCRYLAPLVAASDSSSCHPGMRYQLRLIVCCYLLPQLFSQHACY